MQTQGQNASSLWGGSSNLNGLEPNWGSIGNQNSTGANFGLGLGSTSLSNNTGHNMQSGASSSFGESLNTISSNPLLSNSSRMNFGAPGTLAPGHSAIKSSSSGGNMQGHLSVSGAQPNGPQSNQSSLSGASSQISGIPASSQGNSAFGGNMGFQKIPVGSSSGPAVNPGTSISSNAQNSDNLSSGWGMSSSNNSTLPGTSGWPGNPNSGSDWDQQSTNMSQSQQQIPQTSNTQFRNPNPTGQPSTTDNQRPSSWAQAAGKGLNLHSNNPAAGAAGNVKSPAEMQREAEIRKAIESHDGWGKKPIRQDTQWSIESSPKVQNKFSTGTVVPEQSQQQKGTNNMWNNHNGTAIWEANKENVSWPSNAVARPVGPGQNATIWSGPPQNPPNTSGNSWVGGPPGQTQSSDKSIGSWGTPEGSQPSGGSNWSGSTEIGSWGGAQPSQNSTASGGISTWGEQEGSSGWGEGQGRPVGGNGTAYWGEPQPSSSTQQQQQQPQQWGNTMMGASQNASTVIGQRTTKPDEWNKAGGRGQSGWGEFAGPPDPKIDDGTSLWAANNQQMANAAQWGDTANEQWSATVGKSRPNPQQNPANELFWNTPPEDIWSEESMKGWDDADMGTWNDSSLENNSTWNSATGWNKNKRNSIKGGAIKLPGGTGHPQMRSRLLQQLMDLGFKKDEAQRALIHNNMNIQSALSDLYNRPGAMAGRKDGDMDMFQVDGTKPRMPGLQDPGLHDDISDTQSDSNSFVPNLSSMQNTPFTNAQSQIPNQFPFNKVPSLPPSSRNNSNNSITMLPNKIIQKMHNQQPPQPTQSVNSINQTQGALGRGQLPGNQNMQQQQMAQQQILQQLQMAVQAGLISPALLNQQLPPSVLVMLQQLLQLQQMLQQLITAQQNISQQKPGVNPMLQRQQHQENATRINTIKQQILGLQKKIGQAQKVILNNPDKQHENSTDQSDSLVNKLSPDLSKVSISTTQPQSRLTQWKMTTPDKESPDDHHSDSGSSETPTTTSSGDDNSSLNKAVGSKPIQQSQSTPNLRQNYNELGLNPLGGDTTWSTTPSSSSTSLNWPNTSTPSSTASQGDSANTENKESQSTTTSSGASSLSDSIQTMSIPEFVPGKPWQGITKNPEDDPHITPGSFQRALSVNMVKDDYLSSLTKSSPTSESTSSWPNMKPLSMTSHNLAHKPWSPGSDTSTPSSFSSDVWGLPKGNMSRPPPGLPQQQKGVGWTAVGRQHSWAGPPSRSDFSIGSTNVSTSLVLKNLTPQIDGSTLRTLCMQHGPLQCFFVNTAHGQALVKYSTKEEAMKAQNSLNACPLGNTTIVAEFVSDNDAMRFVEQQNAISAPSQWSQSAQVGNRQSAFGLPSHRSSDMGNWNMSSGSSSGSSMWGNMDSHIGGDSTGAGNLWGMEDPHSVLGNIYG